MIGLLDNKVFGQSNDGYNMIVERYDWGPAVSKVIIENSQKAKSVDISQYIIELDRSSDCVKIPESQKKGTRTIIYGYISD